MAGPWFTVNKSGDDWQKLGHVWISNGEQDCQGEIEVKVELETLEESLVGFDSSTAYSKTISGNYHIQD